MSDLVSIYCDESGHLEHDTINVMVIGAVWCPTHKVPEISSRLREIKAANGQSPRFETKWTKVSSGRNDLYQALLDYFFDDDDLHFRAVVVPDKSVLRHEAFGQSHDDWYYKMYFTMLISILEPNVRHRIYVDIKDTFSSTRIARLEQVLMNAKYDFAREIIERMQPVRSHEIELVQLADLLIGAVSYAHRGLSDSAGKRALVERMRNRSGLSLLRTTLLRENKVNLLVWNPDNE